MNKLKEFFQKNNYLASKVAGGVLTAVIVVALIVLLTTSDNEAESGTDNEGSSTMETTVDIAQNDSTEGRTTENDDKSDTQGTESYGESTTLATEQSISDEESISTSEATSENDDTTTTQRQENAETKTREQNTSKVVTTQPTTIPAPTTQKTTTTQKPTTTKQPEMTTEEETTTAPPRALNGVILEELVLNRVSGAEPLPKSFAKIVANGTPNTVGKSMLHLSVPDVLKPNVLGNEILVYNKDDGIGSVEKDVINTYGEPLYRYVRSDTGGVNLIYKYLPFGKNNEQDLYMRFVFSKDKDYKLIGITLTSFENLQDGEFNP